MLFYRPSNNFVLSWVIALALAAYVLTLVICKRAEGPRGTSKAPYLLPDCKPVDRQLYSVTIDTGLRSRTSMTAKVLFASVPKDMQMEACRARCWLHTSCGEEETVVAPAGSDQNCLPTHIDIVWIIVNLLAMDFLNKPICIIGYLYFMA